MLALYMRFNGTGIWDGETSRSSRFHNKMAAISHLEFLCFNIIALESHVIPHFWLIWIRYTVWFHWYDYFYDLRSFRGQNKMAAVGHIEFLSFAIIALESHVIPHFLLIWVHWFHWYDYFYDLRWSRVTTSLPYIKFSTLDRIALEAWEITFFA